VNAGAPSGRGAGLSRTHPDAQRIDLTPLLTHVLPLARIAEAYELFGSRKDGVLKAAIRVE
jgi:threonine dehydrogenase-like Zn-dependent dehydrogenase